MKETGTRVITAALLSPPSCERPRRDVSRAFYDLLVHLGLHRFTPAEYRLCGFSQNTKTGSHSIILFPSQSFTSAPYLLQQPPYPPPPPPPPPLRCSVVGTGYLCSIACCSCQHLRAPAHHHGWKPPC